MTINTTIEQLKKLIAPEVKVEQTVSLNDTSKNWFELMDELSEAFGLEFLENDGRQCRFKFPGNPVVACSQVKVVWGGIPDEIAYHDLQAFVKIERKDQQTLLVKIYENLMGSRSEQKVYHHVLCQRMEQMVTFLKKEVI